MPRQPFKVALFGTSIVDPNARLPVPDGWGIMNDLVTSTVDGMNEPKTTDEIIADIQRVIDAFPPRRVNIALSTMLPYRWEPQMDPAPRLSHYYTRPVTRKDGV